MSAWRDIDSMRPQVGLTVRRTGLSLYAWRRVYVWCWWSR